MAEFCMECWIKINGTRESKWKYVLSWRKDFCEECRAGNRCGTMDFGSNNRKHQKREMKQ